MLFFRNERGPLHSGIENNHGYRDIAPVSSVMKYVNHLDEGIPLLVRDPVASLEFDLYRPGQHVGIDRSGMLAPSGLCSGGHIDSQRRNLRLPVCRVNNAVPACRYRRSHQYFGGNAAVIA